MYDDLDKMGRKPFLSRGAARAVEIAATVPLIGLLVDNFLKSREYYETNLDAALTSEKPAVLSELIREHNKFTGTLEHLANVYDDAYYKPYTTTKTTIDADGNPHVTLETEYEWDEPPGVPNHRVVFSWRDGQRRFQSDLDYLVSTPVIDAAKLKSIGVDRKTASKLGQGILNTLMYGTEIVLLLGYEEIAAQMSYSGYDAISLSEKVREINTSSQIGRRSFFKVAAAASGAVVAKVVGDYNQGKSAEGREQLEAQIRGIVAKVDVTPKDSFARYFGIEPRQLVDSVQSPVSVSSNVRWTESYNVSRAFEDVADSGGRYAKYLDGLIGNIVPESLAAMTTYGYVTRELKQLSAQQGRVASLGVVIEGLAVGGAMAAILIPAEIVNAKFE